MKTLIAIMFISAGLNAQTPSEIVDKIIKDLNFSKYNKDMIAQAEKDPKYYTLKDNVRVEIKEIKENSNNYNIPQRIPKGIRETLVTIENIVNIAQKVWGMVVANKPVVNVDSKYAVALPKGITTPGELSGWSKPKSYLISFYFENLYGIDVISVSYKITYVYGGNYNGKGKYLAGVWAIPVSIDVLWGFKFNMHASVPDSTVVNVGTASNPIAALQLKVSWSASSFLKEINGTAVYYIQGDGYFEELASPFRARKTNLDNIIDILF